MQKKGTFDQLKELLKEIDEEIDVDGISLDSRLKEDVGLSSVAMLYMAVSVENTFGMDLTDAKMEQLITVGDVVALIEQEAPDQ